MNRNTVYSRFKNIPEQIYKRAEERASHQSVFHNSHRKEEANTVGCLGEVIAEHWMQMNGINYEDALAETTHDYIIINDKQRLSIDVKTKDRTVKPRIEFDNSVPAYNHSHQRPDYFLFISLERDKNDTKNGIRKYHSAYIVGSISCEELDRVGIPFLKNEKDWRNKTKFWTDCINVEMSQLIPLKDTIDIFLGKIHEPRSPAPINYIVVNKMKELIKQGEYKKRKLPA